MANVKDVVDSAEKAALVAREEWEKHRKIRDWAAVKIEIHVKCFVSGVEFAPPLHVYVDDTKQTGELNGCEEQQDDETNCARNQWAQWVTVPVRLRGLDKVHIELRPVDGAERFFRRGLLPGTRFQRVYRRNDLEAHGIQFSVPPEHLDDEPVEAHIVRIEVEPRRRWYGRKRSSDDDKLAKWRLVDSDAKKAEEPVLP